MQNIIFCLLPIWLVAIATLSPFSLSTIRGTGPTTPAHWQGGKYKKSEYDVQVLSPDGKTEAVFNWDQKKFALLIDSSTGAIKAKLKGHSENISDLAFSPDGKMLVTMGSCPDCTARLWDASTGKNIAVLEARKWRKGLLARFSTLLDKCQMDGCPDVLASFSPNSRLIVTTTDNNDTSAKLWNPVTGKLLLTFNHNNPSTEVSIWEGIFSQDSATLITFEKLADWKFQISYWDVRTGYLQKSEPASKGNIAGFRRNYQAYIR